MELFSFLSSYFSSSSFKFSLKYFNFIVGKFGLLLLELLNKKKNSSLDVDIKRCWPNE